MNGDLDSWREELLALILRIVCVLAVVVALPSAGYAAYTGQYSIAVFDAAALLALFAVTFSSKLTFRARTSCFLAIVFLLGVWMLGEVLVVGLGYLLSLPVLAALLLGLRPAMALLILQALVMLVFGYLAVADRPFLDMAHLPFQAWAVITLNFTLVSAMLALGASVLLSRLEAALHHQQQALRSLQQSRDGLQQSHRDLEHEMARRRQVEAENTRLAQVVEQSQAMVLIGSEKGEIIYRNRASEMVFEAAPHSPVQNFVDLGCDSETRALLDDALRKQHNFEGEIRWTGTSGEARVLQLSLSPLRETDTDSVIFVAVLRDVTTEKVLEDRLRQSQRLEATGTFAGGIAHDFNNIIGAILALAEETRSASTEPALHEGIERIETACNRAREIVRQMLLIGRGLDAVERRPERLGAQVREALPLLRAILPAPIEIDLKLGPEQPVRIHPADLNQILLNLASNAAHAMGGQQHGLFRITLNRVDPGSDVLDVHPRLDSSRGYQCLGVSDSGCGIPLEHRQRIFDPFFTTKPLGEGTGLGLPSVHGIVTSLGGDMSVYSELGQGTTFRIYLPEVAESAELPEPAPDPASTDETPSGSGDGSPHTGRILLVDDEPTILSMTARFLTRAGHEVVTAADGDQARDMLSLEPNGFDLLITDLTMPGCSGEELIEYAHALAPQLPAILTSGFGGRRRMVDELESRSLVSYLDKPFRQFELAERVNAALARVSVQAAGDRSG
ncbi:MAG: response regulator [Gammaproteobacteria bacterium]|nr:response regulator [Gammaproteobacteria bacterium]